MSITATAPAPTSVTASDPWAASGRRGPRRHHADATAHHRSALTGRTAVAVADGVGDSAAAGFGARLAADHAVRVASLEGRADHAVAAAHDLLRSAGGAAPGDAALVVALGPEPGRTTWTVAWVGDCRAYAWDGLTLRLLTRDHTVAEMMRAEGVAVHRSLEHVLSTSVRTAGREEIGATWTDDPTSLMLVSDGVHRAVGRGAIASIAGDGGPAELRAERLTYCAASSTASSRRTCPRPRPTRASGPGRSTRWPPQTRGPPRPPPPDQPSAA